MGKKKIEYDKYKLHDVEKVVDDVIKLIKKTHSVKQIVKWHNGYNGEDLYPGSDSVPLKEKINEETYLFNTEGNGTDQPMLKMIITSVFSMGFQQGERYVRKSTDQLLEMYEMMVEKKILKLPKKKKVI